MTLTWFVPLAVALMLGVCTWLISLRLRDASIADIAWGPLFVAMAGADFALGGGHSARGLLVFGLVALWAVRLSVHLGRRNLGGPEDRRYAAMRARYGQHWPLLSLPFVFLFQPLLAFLIAAPVHVSLRLGATAAFGLVDLAGAVLFAAGFTFETIADRQLRRFRADPNLRGHVLDRGLWRYSRHPNYFGECVAWWGLGLIGVAAGSTLSLLGPLLLSLLLLRVSGVTLLEQTITERRPEYAKYQRTTNAFFPGPVRRLPGTQEQPSGAPLE
jgi:steroid 5-alpha reductase family enzyme